MLGVACARRMPDVQEMPTGFLRAYRYFDCSDGLLHTRHDFAAKAERGAATMGQGTGRCQELEWTLVAG